VLDPFCGVGTMLLERNTAVKAKTMYGIDSLGEAIDKARINTKKADVIVNYINRDFFDFKHEYLFDEIITNMPTTGRLMSERALSELYQRFFTKAKEHLKDSAILVLYTHNREFVKKFANNRTYRIEKEFEISMMEGTYVFVLSYHE
jgi:tRNA G10  N-methylase Trm11